MKAKLGAAWLAWGLAASAASAQLSVAPFRQDDPFLFCHDGYETTRAAACWIPVPPYTGGAAWVYTGVCKPPNKYGRDWTQRDYQAFSLYQSVCPQAVTSGEWMGAGSAEFAPSPH